jgi:hypothetical protein
MRRHRAMSRMDDYLTERLRSAKRPVRTDDVAEKVERRRQRLETRRRLGVALLAVGVLVATAGGYLVLSHAFAGGAQPLQEPGRANGPIVVVAGDPPNTGLHPHEHLEFVPIDGSAVVRLTPDRPGWFSGMTAAPDGSRIAYTYQEKDAHAVLTVLDLATGDVRDLVRDSSVAGPAWSPDGSSIAYWDWLDDPGVWIVPADGSGKPVLVAGSQGVAGDPSWSPDGSAIAFEAFDDRGRPAVLTVDIASGQMRKLAPTDGDTPADPVWSPDGAHVDFATSEGIWEVPAGGGEHALLVGSVGRLTYLHHQRWSPDGRVLGYVAMVADSSTVFADALDGSQPSPVGGGFSFAWLPAGGPVPVSAPQGGGPESQTIPGVPYPVCRPTSMPGAFGPGLDTVWVFEEERVPGAGCVGSEGFQRLAVGAEGVARIITGRVTDLISDEAWRVWPYAAPDIDGDGIDEIVIAVRGGEPGTATADSRRIWLFRVDGSHLVPITTNCGAACDPVPWSSRLGPIEGAQGLSTAGVYCGALEGPTADPSLVGFVEWHTDPSDPLLVAETLLQVRDSMLETVAETTYRAPDAASYPPTGLSDLCGASTSPPPVFSTGAY